MILILTEPRDPHADAVIDHLRDGSRAFLRIDPADFPESLRVSYRPVGPTPCLIKGPHGTAAAEDIGSVWNRRPGKPMANAQLSQSIRDYVAKESEAFVAALRQAFPAFWLNDPDANQLANRKLLQLQLAARLGLRIPRTVITNDPTEALNFVDSVEDDLALKAVSTPGITFRDDPDNVRSLMFYTKKVDRKTFLPLAPRLTACPIIIQEYIPKAYELRITVVGEKIFPCAIYSQSSEETKEDWRHWGQKRSRHEEAVLPQSIRHSCLRILAELGLSFGCIDMIITPDGQYVFLEINPNGQWLWIQDETGMPIAKAIADLLADNDRAQ